MYKEYKFIGNLSEKQKDDLSEKCNEVVKNLLDKIKGSYPEFSFNKIDTYLSDNGNKISADFSNSEMVIANVVLNQPNIVYNALSKYAETFNLKDDVEKILASEFADQLPGKTADECLDLCISETAQRWNCFDRHSSDLKNIAFDSIFSLAKKAKEKPILETKEFEIRGGLSKEVYDTIKSCCKDLAYDYDSGFEYLEVCDRNCPSEYHELYAAVGDLDTNITDLLQEGVQEDSCFDLLQDSYKRLLNEEVYEQRETIFFNRFAKAINNLDDETKKNITNCFENSEISLEQYLENYVCENSSSLDELDNSEFIDDLNEYVKNSNSPSEQLSEELTSGNKI